MRKSLKCIVFLMFCSILFISCTDLDEDDDLYLNKNQPVLTSDSGEDGTPPPPPPPPQGDGD